MIIDINNYIDTVMDFPKPWIAFKDISPILWNPDVLSYVVDRMAENINTDIDIIVGLDARWFIFWSLVASKLNKPFVMIRKKGKLPGEVIEETYELEYWTNTQVIQLNSIKKWQKVAIVDDLLATWWTAVCACTLIERLWWTVQWCYFVVELKDLSGIDELRNYTVKSLTSL